MPSEINKLLESARKVQMTDADKEEQRRSFAYGSAHIENGDVTRKIINAAAERMK